MTLAHETLAVLVRLARLAAAVPQPGRPLPSLSLRTVDVVTHQQPDDEYSPNRIEYDLLHWQELCSSVEGGTGSTGSGAGRGDRLSLMCRKADLERAADTLPLHWQSTAWVFRRQHRPDVLLARRRAGPLDVRERESPIPSQALEDAIWRMSRALGWSEHLNVA